MFGPQNLHRIMANYMPSNARSGSLLRRLGFREEGLAKDYLRINGRWRGGGLRLFWSMIQREAGKMPSCQGGGSLGDSPKRIGRKAIEASIRGV